jgi:hypothetical protein
VQHHHHERSDNYDSDDCPQNRQAKLAQKRGNNADESPEEKLSPLKCE